jgi:hypothetical protein
MATKKLVASAVASTLPTSDELIIVSAKDAAYKQAAGFESSNDTLNTVGQYIRTQHPNYPHEKNEALDSMLAEGYLLKLSETKRGAPREFAYIDGNYVDVTQLAAKPKSTEILTIAYATGLSNYDYRKLDNPDKKAVVAQIREMASTYISQRKAALLKKLEELDNPDKSKAKKRADNKTFRKHWEDLFEAGDKKVKLAAKLGDPDADTARYNAAVAAFWKVMNKQ